jgi:hypothetical protein
MCFCAIIMLRNTGNQLQQKWNAIGRSEYSMHWSLRRQLMCMQQWNSVKLIVSELLQNSQVFYESWCLSPCSRVAPVGTVLSQTNPARTLITHFFKTPFNTILRSCVGIPSGLYPSDFPTDIFVSILYVRCSRYKLQRSRNFIYQHAHRFSFNQYCFFWVRR